MITLLEVMLSPHCPYNIYFKCTAVVFCHVGME
jgi:hypothetical protein